MPDRREFLQVSAATAAAALAGSQAIAADPLGPFSNPTRTFDPHELDELPAWVFTQSFNHMPTIRPKNVSSFDKLKDNNFVFHTSEPIPIGQVYHGTALEFFSAPPIWKQFFNCSATVSPAESWKQKIAGFGTFAHHATGKPIANWGGFPIKTYVVPMREGLGKLRPDAGGDARFYGYDGRIPGPLFRHRIGQPAVVRFVNHLETEASIHLHGGHSPSHSDGFPSFYVLQNKARDYFYPNNLPMHTPHADDKKELPQSFDELQLRNGQKIKRYDAKLGANFRGDVPDMTEAQSTMWYHDHAMDATAYNVSKGLAGMALCYSEPELWLIANKILPGLGAKSCIDPDEQGLGADPSLEDPKQPGYYAYGKEPFHNPYDIPMVLQDKIIDRRTGQISYDSQGHNGYLGTTMFVNGVAWPTLTVKNRKYRFRWLDGCNARILRLRILSEADYLRARDQGMTSEEYERCSMPFLQIGKDSWMWSQAVTRKSVVIAMANRADVVVDFTGRNFQSHITRTVNGKTESVPVPGMPGGRRYYLVNTMPQNDGRGPKVKLEDPNDPRMQALPFETDSFKLTELIKPIPMMQFVVEGDAIKVEDDAEIHPTTTLIAPRPRIRDEEVRVVREFVFERGKGFWMINKRFYDPTISNASPVLGSAEEWILRNGGGGWWHPIHIHLEAHQLVAYLKDFAADNAPEGKPTPIGEMNNVTEFIDRTELIANHDTQILGPNTAVRIRMRYRTWPGPFVFHCHNVEHEDMRMMFNFEPVPVEGDFVPPMKFEKGKHDPDTAPTARTQGNDVTFNGYDKDKNPEGRMGELPWELYPVPITPVERGGEFLIPPRPSTKPKPE